MSYVDDLITAATDSLVAGTSVQVTVRTVLEQEGADAGGDNVAIAMGIFKEQSESHAMGIPNSVEQMQYRKKINNVINDVSRICRECIGKSIVLKSRKDGYVYMAKEPIKRPSKAEDDDHGVGGARSSATLTPTARVDYLEAEIMELRKKLEVSVNTTLKRDQEITKLNKQFELNPVGCIRTLLDYHGSEALSNMVIEELKQASLIAEIPF